MRRDAASGAAELRRFVADTLAAASREILAAVDSLVAELEQEAAGVRRQVARQLEVRSSGAKCRRSSSPAEQENQENPENQENQENPGRTSPSRRRRDGRTGKKNHILLRVRILDGPRTAVLSHSDLRRNRVQELRCRPGLQEADFALLLRTRFPQLARGGAFDLLTSDRRRRLRPLEPRRLTPEEIQRSSRRRSSTVHIRLKEQEPEEPAGAQNRPISSSASKEPGRTSSPSVPEVHGPSVPEVHGPSVPEVHGPSVPEVHGPGAAGATWNSSGTEMERSDGEETSEPENDGTDGENWRPERTEGRLTGVKQGPAGSAGSPGSPGPGSAGVGGIKLERGVRDVPCKVRRSVLGPEAALAEDVLRRHAGGPEDVCGEAPESAGLRAEHLQDPHRPLPLPPERHRCAVCRQEFPLREQLKTHRRSHGGGKAHPCGVCGKSLSDYRSLSRHMTVHSEERPHACALCGKRFKLVGTLRQHEKIHTERQRSFLCDVCCKMFLTAQQLRDHMATHAAGGGRRHRCAQCGRGFAKKGALTLHQRVHSGDAPYRCPHCGWAFRWRSNLAEHLRVHSGAKPYVCAVCGKACARKVYLTVHMRTHSGERPYRCAVCHKVFTQSHCLKTHMRRHQGAAAT